MRELINKCLAMKEMKTIKEGFVGEIRGIIDKAREGAVRSVDFCRVQMYWNIGRRIFEEEQQGKARAEYGSYLIKRLSWPSQGEREYRRVHRKSLRIQ